MRAMIIAAAFFLSGCTTASLITSEKEGWYNHAAYGLMYCRLVSSEGAQSFPICISPRFIDSPSKR